MDQVFDFYFNILKARIDSQTFQGFSEDSVRFDFCFSILSTSKELSNTNFILEEPMPKGTYKPVVSAKERLSRQGRHDNKPEYDLSINPCSIMQHGLIAEFSFFRKGAISDVQALSKLHGKLINDIYRISLLKYHKPYREYPCYVICLTDSGMMNYGYGSRGREAIPIQEEYDFRLFSIDTLPATIRNSINDMFTIRTKELSIVPTAKRVYTKVETVNSINEPWTLWIWEVGFENK